MGCELLIASTNPLRLVGLRDDQGFVNDADVKISIGDLVGYQDLDMEYVEDSDAIYLYDLPAAAPLVDDAEYDAEMVATWTRDGQPYTASFVETYLAVASLKSFGPDVYATCKDLSMIFGKSNVDKWADLNNTEVAKEIRERKAWALHLASRRIDDALGGGPYATPFNLPYDTLLIDTTARLAGVLLYEGRLHEDSDSTDNPVMSHKREVESWLRGVRGGIRRLSVPTHALAPFPTVVKDARSSARHEGWNVV